jgi:hypothetical protein
MSQEIIRGVLDDHGLFYLGTVMDGARTRGVGQLTCGPQHIQHVVYMQDTNLLLSIDPDRKLVTPLELQELVREQISKDYEVSYHEIGEVIQGILSGDMSYLDWLRLPIINQPDPEYLRKIFVALEANLEDCYLALVERATWGGRATWMPLDYRQAQLLAFARTGKIEVNYFTALAHLQEDADGYQVYESATDEVRFQRLAQELRSIETNARRGIL